MEADNLDRASDLAQAERDCGIHASQLAAQSIPAGTSGECTGCGDYFARIVDGKCGFCRDGRMRA